jgi:pimeloyl-ACP methyl ester carboxylesterase
MPTPTGLVLIHGSGHAGDCWDPTVAELKRQAPHLPVLAVDRPGRSTEPGDLSRLTIHECVQSVLRQIDEAGLDRVVLVGHSQAGITMPGVAEKLGAARSARLIFISCAIPPEGTSVIDNLHGPLRFMIRRRAERGGMPKPMPRALAAWLFCNGMTAEQRTFTLDRQYPEAPRVLLEPVHRALPPVPRTWVLLTADRVVSERTQRRYIDNLGGVDEVVTLHTCHDAMISAPVDVAALLAARVDQRASADPA